MPKWLRVVMIVVICLALLAATGFMLLVWALGGFRSLSPEHPETAGMIAAYVLIMAGGVFGIVALVRGFFGVSQPGDPVAYEQPLPGPDPEKVVQLRLAMAAKVGLSALFLIYSVVPKPGSERHVFPWPVLVSMVISFVVYQAPYAALFFVMEKKLQRFPLAITLTLPWVFVLWSAYRWLMVRGFQGWGSGMKVFLISSVVFAALEVVIFALALQLREYLGSRDRGALLAGTAVLSVVYVVGVGSLTTFVSGMLYRFSY